MDRTEFVDFVLTDPCVCPRLQVEVTFHGEPICPSSTVHGLVELWLRREPEQPVQAALGAPATGFVMALGYRRRHRPYPDVPCEGDGTAVEPA